MPRYRTMLVYGVKNESRNITKDWSEVIELTTEAAVDKSFLDRFFYREMPGCGYIIGFLVTDDVACDLEYENVLNISLSSRYCWAEDTWRVFREKYGDGSNDLYSYEDGVEEGLFFVNLKESDD